MRKDLAGRADIETVVNAFYEAVRRDELLGPVFNAIISDWSTHLPRIYAFWDSAIFDAGSYRGNVIAKHIEVDKAAPLGAAHYTRWLRLWTDTIDTKYTGAHAEKMKSKAAIMLQLIDFKICAHRDGKSLL